jgi:hypothetical protein
MRILQDYATRYEELLLENRKLHNGDGDPENDGDDDYDVHGLNKETSNKHSIRAAKILANHAAMEGMFLTTIQAAKSSIYNSNAVDTATATATAASIESMRYLLEETLHCNDFGLDAAGKPKSSSLGTVTELAAMERHKQMTMHDQQASISAGVQDDGLDFDSENEVDEFFEEYPECVHDDWNYFELEVEVEAETKTELVNDENDHFRTRTTGASSSADLSRGPLHVDAAADGNQTNIARNPYMHDNEKGTRPQQYQVPMNNPYDKTKHAGANSYMNTNVHSHARNNTHTNTLSTNHTNNQSWDMYHARNEDPTRQHLVVPNKEHPRNHNGNSNHSNHGSNPFRTARELKQSNSLGDTGNANDDPGNDYDFDTNGRMQTEQDSRHTQTSYNPHRPNLSAGLKRKFQNPKSHNAGAANDRGQHSKANSNHSSRGGSHSNRNGRGKGNDTRVSDNPSKENGDDDLPEELKGLDKELIAKIENEIVDSGDPITFKDIAGLHDAKQTVMELVCWPMKRPDLFTGLRRGPNGLLLYVLRSILHCFAMLAPLLKAHQGIIASVYHCVVLFCQRCVSFAFFSRFFSSSMYISIFLMHPMIASYYITSYCTVTGSDHRVLVKHSSEKPSHTNPAPHSSVYRAPLSQVSGSERAKN